MTKEKRLGRGLEALLGQIHAQSEPALPAQYHRVPTPTDPAVGQDKEEPQGITPHPRPAPSGDYFQYPSGDPLSAENPAAEGGTTPAFAFPAQVDPAVSGPQRVAIDKIDSNPDQPRQDFNPEELKDLAESISSHGLLQPVVVRRVHDRYQVVAGERRLRRQHRPVGPTCR